MRTFIGMTMPGADFSSSQVPARVSRAMRSGALTTGRGQDFTNCAISRSTGAVSSDSSIATKATSCSGGSGKGAPGTTYIMSSTMLEPSSMNSSGVLAMKSPGAMKASSLSGRSALRRPPAAGKPVAASRRPLAIRGDPAAGLAVGRWSTDRAARRRRPAALAPDGPACSTPAPDRGRRRPSCRAPAIRSALPAACSSGDGRICVRGNHPRSFGSGGTACRRARRRISTPRSAWHRYRAARCGG